MFLVTGLCLTTSILFAEDPVRVRRTIKLEQQGLQIPELGILGKTSEKNSPNAIPGFNCKQFKASIYNVKISCASNSRNCSYSLSIGSSPQDCFVPEWSWWQIDVKGSIVYPSSISTDPLEAKLVIEKTKSYWAGNGG